MMRARQYLTAVFSIALVFGASKDLRTQTAPRRANVAMQAATAGSATSAAALNKYCVACHNEKVRAGGLALDALNPDDPGTNAGTWEKVVRKLRSGAMPPAGRPRPDAATYNAVASHLEARLDAVASARPEPGRLSLFHRLSRTEYKNAIRDLLSLDDLSKDVDLDLLLPADNSSSGFDNIADLLFVSSTQLEQYLSAAQKLSSVVVGDRSLPPLVDTYRLSDQFNQEYQAEGAAFGTRGGTVIRTYLPLDGEYRIHIELADAARDANQIEIAVDDERVALIAADVPIPSSASTDTGKKDAASADVQSVAEQLDEIATPIKINSVVNRRFELDRRSEVRRRALAKGLDVDVPLKAGPRVIAVTFLKRTSAKGEALIRPRLRSRGQLPAIASVTIRGPVTVAGLGDTPSRRKVFICTPSTTAADLSAGALAKAEADCAKKILSSLARRAYRRPVTDNDLQPLLSVYDAERGEGGFEAGIRQGLERILVSPQFLFRIERQPAKIAPGAVYRISDLELASRLSFFLWSSIPDDELLDLAAHGKLSSRAVLDQQVRRMLKDPRSAALATNFAAQWLYLRDVQAKTPSPRLFPDFDLSLREAFERETTLFLESVFREDRSVIDLLSANDTFMNERLARHYGVPNVFGNDFRRVAYPDDNPRHGLGLLGHSSILTITSYANRTSPVLRGKYVLGNLLGSPPAPPPPNIPALATVNKDSGKVLPMREALALHRANPACASCHAQMDPIGFAMDNFDALGRWRTVDASGVTIDPSGVLPDGTRFEGVAGLRQVLLSQPERFVGTLTENLLGYALGRSLEHYDLPVVRSVVRGSAARDYRFSELVFGVVNSMPFQMRKAEVQQ
jgi:mono/diheme cytochrome c family protein